MVSLGMRKMLVIVIFVMLNLVQQLVLAQVHDSERPDSAYVFPDSVCIACNGSTWQNPMNATLLPPPDYSEAFLLPYGQCNQDTCYYSREFRFSDFGFNIPLDATIDSFTVHISQGSSSSSSIKDSIVQLMKNHTPQGDNYAYPYPWQTSQDVYYPNGLYGITWTPEEVNDSGFGFLIRVKNYSSDSVLAFIEGGRITVFYSIANGIFSQSSGINSFTLFPNPASTSLTVQSMVNSPWSVVNIYSAQGALVLTSSNIINQTLNIENLSTGLYYMHLQSAEGVAVKKFEVIR